MWSLNCFGQVLLPKSSLQSFFGCLQHKKNSQKESTCKKIDLKNTFIAIKDWICMCLYRCPLIEVPWTLKNCKKWVLAILRETLTLWGKQYIEFIITRCHGSYANPVVITIGLAGKMFGMCEIGISHLWRFSHQKKKKVKTITLRPWNLGMCRLWLEKWHKRLAFTRDRWLAHTW